MHVFVSYVRENQVAIDRLSASLREAGIQVWLDRERIKPGQRWQWVVREAIQSGAYFIACFSKEYRERDKTYMNEELILAIKELRKMPTDRAWFIPVLLSECELPDHEVGVGETIRDIQWVSLEYDWGEGISRLLQALGVSPTDSNKIAEKHTGDRLLDSAWNNYISGSDERKLYRLGEAAALGHPGVKEELLRAPVCEHSLSIAKLNPFPEFIPIAIRELTTTYDQSNFSAADFLDAATSQIADKITEEHLVPAVATAIYLAEIGDDNESATSFSCITWFVSNVGRKNKGLKSACLHILDRIGETDLDDWHRNDLNKAISQLSDNNA